MDIEIPSFPLETCNRLCVQSRVIEIGDADVWSPPRPAKLDDLVAALLELPEEKRAEIAKTILKDNRTVRLIHAEEVLDAFDDVRKAMKRLDEYCALYPDAHIGIPF